MYIGDVVTWLEHLQLPVNINCLDVVPVMMPSNNIVSASGGAPNTLSNFGYGADGPMVNGTIICGLVALVLYAVVHKVSVPSALVKTLQGIQALYTKHDSGTSRLVSNMVSSAVNRKMNRSMDDPLLLAGELNRQGLASQEIRQVVRMYQARTSTTSSLTLKRCTADATIRIMDPAKISVQAVAVLSRITLKTGWDIGPLSADALLAPKLVIGASLVDTSNEEWGLFAVQAARGQTEALLRVEHKMNAELALGSNITRVNQDQLNQIAVAAGLPDVARRDSEQFE